MGFFFFKCLWVKLIPRIFGSKRNGGRGSSDEDSLKSDGDNGFDFGT